MHPNRRICVYVMFDFAELPDSYYGRTAKVGRTVKFPCPTKLDKDVDWVYLKNLESRQKHIYLGKIGIDDSWLDPRFTMLYKTQSHSLVIHNVTVDDSAYYRCVEDSGQGRRHFYRLTVTVEGICSTQSYK